MIVTEEILSHYRSSDGGLAVKNIPARWFACALPTLPFLSSRTTAIEVSAVMMDLAVSSARRHFLPILAVFVRRIMPASSRERI
jgi:hypothetical protein